MTFYSQASVQRIGAALALWRNVRVQRVVLQLAFGAVVIVVGYLLLTNLTSELDRVNLEPLPFIDLSASFPFIDLKLDFLGQRAGFGIKETSFGREYSGNDSYGEAYLVGLLNTVRVAVLGIVLATAVGLVAGVARLSSNWLVSRLATVYVEVFRNVPLLVQLIFWYTAVFLRLPKISEGRSLFGVAYLSNRAVALPWAGPSEGFGLWLLLLGLALAVAVLVWVYRMRREERTGRASFPRWWAFGTFALISIGTFFATGAPVDFERPELGERAYFGGLQLSPEFGALLVGLVLYTGAFIAEVARGSILAIPKGQTEAAAAVGLSALQRLRFVILPQAMRIMIPPLTNQYLNLTKNSSLAVFVAFPDLFQVSRVTINQTGQAVAIIVLVMLTYLTMSLLTSLIMNTLNSRLQVATR
jgi:general L-amino acid transport system permease protein